jgi:hypothetical protein
MRWIADPLRSAVWSDKGTQRRMDTFHSSVPLGVTFTCAPWELDRRRCLPPGFVQRIGDLAARPSSLALASVAGWSNAERVA